MIRSDAQFYTETGKRELPKRLTQASHPGEKNNVEIKTCKHLANDGWCNKKHQHCPLMNLLFINQ